MASASMTTPEDGAEGAGVSPDSSVSAASLGANHFLQKAEHFSRMSITIDCGRLEPSSYTHSGLKLLSSKPNLYVEMTVDEKPSSRKTEFCRSSYQPRWHAQFAVPVTPYSQINFKLWDHSSFKRDPLVAFGELGMYHVLLQHEGKIQSRTVSVDLYVAQNNSSSSHCNGVQPSGESAVPIRTGDTVTASPSSTSTQEMKRCGELIVILDGMNVDMSSLPSPSPKPSINNNTSDRGVLPAGNGSVPSADGSASSQSSSRRRLSQELGSRVSAMSLSGPQDPKRNSTSSQPGDSARFPPLSRSGSSTNSGASSQTASMSGRSLFLITLFSRMLWFHRAPIVKKAVKALTSSSTFPPRFVHR